MLSPDQREQCTDPIEGSISSTVHWLKDFSYQAFQLQEELVGGDPRAFEHLLWPYMEILKETASKSHRLGVNKNRTILLGNEPFNITRLPGHKPGVPGSFVITPGGGQTPLDIRPIKKAAEIYTKAYYEIFALHEPNMPAYYIPTPYTFFIPSDWNPYGIKVSPKSWVNDFGPAIFIFESGRDGLSGSFEAHPYHEAFHRWSAIKTQLLYLKFLMHHPYINETFAEAVGLLHHTHPESYGGTRLESPDSNPTISGLPNGNALRYYKKLSVHDLLEPLGFQELNGQGKYVPELYSKRLPLTIFVALLASKHRPFYEENLDSYFLRLLNFGLSATKDTLSYERTLKIESIMSVYQKLNNQILMGGQVNSDIFWGTFLSERISTAAVENVYRRVVKLITPLYVMGRDYLVEEDYLDLWNSLPPQIRDILTQHAPTSATVYSDWENTDFHSKLKSLPT